MPTLPQLGEKIDHAFCFLTCTNSAEHIKDENFKKRYEAIESNNFEKIGSICSWHVKRLPTIVATVATNPYVMTVALGAIALLAVQVGFYPIITWSATKTIASVIAKHVSLQWVKFGIYVAIQSAIFGTTLEAIGRLVRFDQAFSQEQAIEVNARM